MNIRPEREADCAAIHALVEAAFDGEIEAVLVDALRSCGDLVLSLVPEEAGSIIGHAAFSRLGIINAGRAPSPALSLTPISVWPDQQLQGIVCALVRAAHEMLERHNACLSVVLGDPDYYPRFGYGHERASRFTSRYQCETLHALSFGSAPHTGTPVYAPAFEQL